VVAPSLYEEVVAITARYLGPAARRFITRQVAFHLSKTPETLTQSDIPALAEWAQATLALLTEDQEMVDNFAAELMKLAGPQQGA
jgi:hypothetical protein